MYCCEGVCKWIKNKDIDNERKLVLIDSLCKCMGVLNMLDIDDEEMIIGKKCLYLFLRKFKKRK